MTARRTTNVTAAWAIKLVSAQQPLPGLKGGTPLPRFCETVSDGKGKPLLFSAREKARSHKNLNRSLFAASIFRAVVVPVRVTTEEMPTLERAARGD